MTDFILHSRAIQLNLHFNLEHAMNLKQTQRLLEIMQHLRDPEHGCAWNREQDFQSLAPYTLEEAYEVVDAIQENDMDKLKDELGDLLLQVVFQAQVASEQGLFTFEDIAQNLSDKMERRHSHVFGSDRDLITSAEDVDKLWEDHKATERAAQKKDSLLDDVAKALPALTRAAKLSKRAARVGFEWDNFESVMDKVHEELNEFKAEVAQDTAEQHDEFGDFLFTIVNVARWRKIDPEAAMRDANDKFEKRFRYMEKHAPQPLSALTIDEMEALWNQAKKSGL